MSTPSTPEPHPLVPPSAGDATGAAQQPFTWDAQYASVPGPTAGESAEAGRRAGTALGWAIGAAVAAGIALVTSLVAVVLAFGAGSPLDDPGSYEPLRGQVVGLPDGAALSGDRLERVIVDLQRDWGGEDVQISCPDTSSVRVSTVVVCRGDIDGYQWTGAALFEDSAGNFVVAEF